jgi:hypothetical protein
MSQNTRSPFSDKIDTDKKFAGVVLNRFFCAWAF